MKKSRRSLFAIFIFVICLMAWPSNFATAKDQQYPAVPSDKAVYDAPNPLPAGTHGDLIWAEEITTKVPAARAWKILYLSSDIHDNPVPVSGLVISPSGAAPKNGRPVVTFAHGTTGLARNCAPSSVDDPAKDALFYFSPASGDQMDSGIPGLSEMISADYVVVATDYSGLGTPGFHQYLVGPTAARNTLDAAVAAQQIPEAAAGKTAVVLGWSEGGQAAVWAGQISDYTSDRLNILGVAALAPVNSLEQLKAETALVSTGKKLPDMTAAETVMSIYAACMTFPELKLSDIFTPAGIDFITEAAKHQCSKHMGQSLAYMQNQKGSAMRPDPQNLELWTQFVEKMALGNTTCKIPVAVYQGDADPTIFPAATEAYIKKACSNGTNISYNHYPATDHLQIPVRAKLDYLNWIADRFAGKQAISNCK